MYAVSFFVKTRLTPSICYQTFEEPFEMIPQYTYVYTSSLHFSMRCRLTRTFGAIQCTYIENKTIEYKCRGISGAF